MASGVDLLPHRDPATLLAWAAADDPDLRALVRLAGRLDALFLMPGAAVATLGATFTLQGRRVSVTGAGATRRGALAACLGELAETLSLVARAGDACAQGSLSAPPAGAGLSKAELAAAAARGIDPAATLDWLAAVRLPDGAACLLPAALVLRPASGLAASGVDAAAGAAPPASLGAAAGPTLAAAVRRGALELFERAALAGWRAGGAARALADAPAAPGVRLARLDAGDGPAVVLAVSARGRGVAAAEAEADAVARALCECAAAEAGAAFADALRAARAPGSPFSALSRPARLRCAPAPNASAPGAPFSAAGPSGPSTEAPASTPPGGRRAASPAHGQRAQEPRPPGAACAQPAPVDAPPAPGALDAALARQAAAGWPVRVVDLTRADLGVPAAKAVCLGLDWADPGE